jgi:translation initiation factor 1 (eIF-1/SUI1)
LNCEYDCGSNPVPDWGLRKNSDFAQFSISFKDEVRVREVNTQNNTKINKRPLFLGNSTTPILSSLLSTVHFCAATVTITIMIKMTMDGTGRREAGASGNRKPITMADFFRPIGDTADTENKMIINSTSTSTSTSNTLSSQEKQQSIPPSSYTVRATKKGNVPVVIESRKHHKVVVLSNIEGDIEKLLSVLKKKLGTGGSVQKGNNSIEISGGKDKHLEVITKFCIESGCLVGASKQTKGTVETSNSKKNEKEQKTEPTKIEKAPLSTIVLSPKVIKTMKPIKLKEHLSARQLSTQGNKKELIARLMSSVATPTDTETPIAST